MTLVEQHQIKRSHPAYAAVDDSAFKSKNLYNATLYRIRQHYFHEHEYLNYNQVSKDMQDDPDYVALPRKVGQQTQKLVDQNFKSFFASKRAGVPAARLPKYLDKNGRYVLVYTSQAISYKHQKEGYITLSGLPDLKIYTDKPVESARIVPMTGGYCVELLYSVAEAEPIQSENYAAIDLGIGNLATVISNVFSPIIINGKPVKSINRYYNKEMARLASIQKLENKTTKRSRRMNVVTRKRNNRIKDYLHKSSRMIANQLASRNVSTLVIGLNKQWKQDVDMGRKNNQKFVSIPYDTLIRQLQYKCQLLGIQVVIQEEAYTSKCSFLDNEDIGKHDDYMGRRIKRGLFKASDGRRINADVNGGYNILRKWLKVVDKSVMLDSILACSTPKILQVT